MSTLPSDYLERVYAAVLGKLIGVYLGRPFEGWTHDRIVAELGPINYYVHDRLGQPLVITDDDVAGTFTFLRALEDYGVSTGISARDIGKAWMNYIIRERSILWWGGNGNSTEHTAWLNLKKGIPAPESGAIATNGRTVAEQIGAQIFIDGWALVAPGRPGDAAKMAEQAGSVSHDGESVHAAMLWAAMEAEAFGSADVDHLIDTGLSVIPPDSLIARLIADIRAWHGAHPDWLETRQLIEDTYGYDKYPGTCHVVPNHALMIMALLYAPDDFQRAQMIVNTSGWDTDCNAGNLGCLMGIMLGLDGIGAGPDWRGPVADRMLISSADGGFSINDAVRISYYLVNLGRELAGAAPLAAPKDGAQFHFSLPGSRQGFRVQPGAAATAAARVENLDCDGNRVLALRYQALGPAQEAAAVTPTFSPPEVLKMRTYDLMATPRLYPGQVLRAQVSAGADNLGDVAVALRLRPYGAGDALVDLDGQPIRLAPGAGTELEWRIPDLDGQPVAEAGIVVTAAGRRADGAVLLDWLRWDGPPEVTLKRPAQEADFWRMAWVNAVDVYSKYHQPSFRISQAAGQGLIIHGTREWTDYRVETELLVDLCQSAGVAVRVQGQRRYYQVRLTRQNRLEIVRERDEASEVLASVPFDFALSVRYPFRVTVEGNRISADVAGTTIACEDAGGQSYRDGGIGLVISDGALSADAVHISAI
ncbi:MAG: ADP-ribosylglycohydrolase family protein [Paracoccus sp. (in: a-proteobacteria)]